MNDFDFPPSQHHSEITKYTRSVEKQVNKIGQDVVFKLQQLKNIAAGKIRKGDVSDDFGSSK